MPRSLARLPIIAVVLPLAVAGCTNLGPNAKRQAAPCPPVYILSDAASITKYKPGPGRDLTDVELEAEIVGFKGDCRYDDKGAIVELRVSLDVKRGPANTSRQSELSYFIAIPKFYPSSEAKAVFTLPIEFPVGMDQARATDEDVILRVPMKDRENVAEYEIYLGIQATPEQLDATRRSKR